MKPQDYIRNIITSFEYHTQDIDNVFSKEWLKTAIKSHVANDTGYPREVVNKTVELIFLADNI